MRLILLVPHFPPDVAPTGEVAGRWVDELAAAGHEIHVVTSLPWYRSHRVEDDWRSRRRRWRNVIRTDSEPWGSVTRVHPCAFADKENLFTRAIGFVGFSLLSLIAGLGRGRADGVIAMSPPLTIGPVGWLVARRSGAPYVFNVQDVYPDVLVDTGAMEPGLVTRALSAVESLTYRLADAVTVLSDDLRDNVKQRGGDPDHFRVIPNFVDLARISPGPRENGYRDELGLGGRTVVLYAGNVGYSQPLDLVIDAARALADRTDVVFVINGGGSGFDRLIEAAADLDNVVFAPLQPRERLPEVLAAGDIHLVVLRRGLAKVSVPSKVYSILAAGRPVLASIDPDTEITRLVAAAECGVCVPPEDPAAFVAGLITLIDDLDRAAAQGDNGRRHVEGWLSPAGVARAYETLLRELTAR